MLIAPTASGSRVGTGCRPLAPARGLPTLPNNVLPFDIAKNAASLVNWGDSTNTKLLTALTLSITRQNTVADVGNCRRGAP